MSLTLPVQSDVSVELAVF